MRRKLAEFEALGPPPAPKRFVDGGWYHGRDYRLTLVDDPAQPVTLDGERLELASSLDGEARAVVVAWYEARAREYIDAAVARYVPLVGAAPAAVVVRDLGKRRWGVCDRRTLTVSLHWQLIARPQTWWTTSWSTSSSTSTNPTTGRRSGAAWRTSCPTARRAGDASHGAHTSTCSDDCLPG